MKNIDLNIRTDDLNIGIVNDDATPIRVETKDNKVRLVKILFEGDSIDQAQEILLRLVEKKTGPRIAMDTIEALMDRYERMQVNQRGEPVGLLPPEKRKIYSILEASERMKDGVLEIEDDHATYLKDLFSKVGLVGGTKPVVRVLDAIDASFIQKPAKSK